MQELTDRELDTYARQVVLEDIGYEGVAAAAEPRITPFAMAPAGHGLFTFFLIAATLLMVYTTIVLINMTITHTNVLTDWIPGVFNK